MCMGAPADNIQKILTVADGVIVDSHLKENGYTWNPVYPARVKACMEAINQVRKIKN